MLTMCVCNFGDASRRPCFESLEGPQCQRGAKKYRRPQIRGRLLETSFVRRASFFSLINLNYAIGAVKSDKIALP